MGAREARATGRLVSVGLLAVLLAACSGGSPSSAPASSAPAAPSGSGASAPAAASNAGAPPQLLQAKVAYTTIAAVQAPFWIAYDAGYFREQGLDVPEMNRVEPGATLLAALHNGELDVVAAGGTSLVLGNLQGLETMIVGSTLHIFEDAIAVKPEIRTVEDLRGKTIGVSRLKAISDTAARMGLERLGLTPDVDVFFRGTGGNAESLAALQQGSADGASISVPATFKAESLGFPILVDITAMNIAVSSQ